MKYTTKQDLPELIGKRFKRNVYGLTEWTDTVKDCWFVYIVNIEKGTTTQEIIVKGSNYDYPINELVILP